VLPVTTPRNAADVPTPEIHEHHDLVTEAYFSVPPASGELLAPEDGLYDVPTRGGPAEDEAWLAGDAAAALRGGRR
jgi:hypothetical protein